MATLRFDLHDGKMINQDTGKVQKTTKIEIGEEINNTHIEFSGDKTGQVVATLNGDDITITAYGLDKNGDVSNKVLGTITIKNGSSSETIDNKLNGIVLQSYDWIDQALVKYPYELGDLTAKKSLTLNGSDLSEKYSGGTKADKIFTKGGYDEIEAGKGDDTIVIGDGEKSFFVHKGDGHDTISVDPEYEEADKVSIGFYGDPLPGPKKKIGYEEPTDFTIKKKMCDLTINANYADGTTDSVTLNEYDEIGLLGIHLGGRFDTVNMNGKDVDEYIENKYVTPIEPKKTAVEVNRIEIEGEKVSDLTKSISLGKDEKGKDITAADALKKLGIKIPGGLSNANIHLGTAYNDNFTGTTNKDLMISMGGDNKFVTGTKGQTIIASLNESSEKKTFTGSVSTTDAYTVSSFTAGTVIVDQDGEYNMEIKDVDTNDIHMMGIDIGSMMKGSESASTIVEYLTDTKGVKNITGLDFNDIYNKVKEIQAMISDFDPTDKKQIKTINSALGTVNSLIEKFRGVAVVTKRDVENDGLYGDLTVTDKNGVEHTISADSQEAYTMFIMQNISAFAENMSHKFGMDMESLIQAVADPSLSPISVEEIEEAIDDGYIDKAFVKKYFKYVKENTKEEIPAHYELSKAAVKEITGGLTDVFTNSYVGTDGDNSFTISHSDAGAVVAAGTGNDTITFKGEIGNTWKDRPYAYNPVNPPVYNIVSSLNTPEIDIKKEAAAPSVNDHDTIVFKNYTKDKDLFAEFENGHQYDIDKREVYGMDFYASKWDKKSSTYGEVHYIIGEDGELDEDGDYVNNTPYSIKGNKFELTVKDKSSTYEISAEQNDTITEDWSKDKSNHYAVVQSAETEIKTGKGKNMIESYGISTVPTKGTNPTLSYTYGGGQDKVISKRESNDTYYAKLTGKTDLVIYDSGDYDNDKLILTNTEKEAKNIRAYFNVDRDSGVSDELNISLISGKLSKSSFDIVEVDEKMIYQPYIVDGLKNGIDFNYNYYNDYGIENIYYGEDETKVNMDAIVSQVQSELAGWFSKYEQYDSTDAAIIADDKNAIKDLVAVYNSVDLTYNPVVS